MAEGGGAEGRFAVSAERLARLTDERSAELRERVRRFVPLTGTERALDSGAGTGALAFALAPLVREVVAVDVAPEFLAEGRKRASADAANVEFVEGDAMALPFGEAEFDLAGSLKTLHHLPRPELAVAELARVTRPGGLLLVVDQVAPIDPIAAVALDRFERARDPSHTRVLPDTDFRGLFDANDLVLRRAEFQSQRREVEPYLDLAGCEGGARNRARALAGGASYEVTVGWYLLVKPPAT
jgi:ubiquinone/menaquinone biosynthesis C-methylase UbiE